MVLISSFVFFSFVTFSTAEHQSVWVYWFPSCFGNQNGDISLCGMFENLWNNAINSMALRVFHKFSNISIYSNLAARRLDYFCRLRLIGFALPYTTEMILLIYSFCFLFTTAWTVWERRRSVTLPPTSFHSPQLRSKTETSDVYCRSQIWLHLTSVA